MSPERSARPARRRPVLAAFAGVLALLVLAIVAAGLSRAGLRAAEQERVAERARLAQQVGEYTVSAYDPEQLRSAALRTPFTAADPALAARLLEQFRTSPVGDPTTLAALVTRDGTVAAVSPAGAKVPSATLGTEITAALGGDAVLSGVFDLDGEPSWATVAPVGLDRWAALVVVQAAADSSAQLFVQQLGSLSPKAGGLALVDAEGRALISWDPGQLGSTIADPADLAGLPGDRTVVGTLGSGDDEVTTVSRRLPDGRTGLFRQDTDDLFADLREQQWRRDVTLLAVTGIALLALLGAGLARLRHVRRSAARLDALLTNTHDVILVATRDGELTFVSPAVRTVLGRDPDELLGRPLADLTHPADAEALAALLADPTGLRTVLDVRLLGGDGAVRWFDVEAADASGTPELRDVVLTCHEIGRRKTLQDELVHQARHDALTGLPNRLVMTSLLAGEVAAERPGGVPGPALLFVDLDRFKEVNDAHGHAAGDQVLRTVAERLADVARPDDVVCRFGGDEFAVVLPRTGRADAERLAAAVVEALARPIPLEAAEPGAGDAEIGASVGIAVTGRGPVVAEDVLRAADAAMYRAKALGRGRYAVHEGHASGAAPAPAGSAHPQPRPAPNPRPASPARPAQARRKTPREQLAAVTAVAVTALVVLSVTGVGLWQTQVAQRDAERQRLGERLQLTARVAGYARVLADPQRLLRPVNAAPWVLDGGVVDTIVVQAVLASGIGGEGTRAQLRRLDGTALVTAGGRPPGADVGGTAWRTALEGRVGYVPLVADGDTLFGAYAVPVLRDGRPAAVLVVAQQLELSVAQGMLEALGSLGFGEGGVSSVERTGRATHSWNPALIGTRVVDPAALAGLPFDRATQVQGPAGLVTLAAPIRSQSFEDAKVIVFQQPTAAFYGDLRSGQLARDLLLLGVAVAAIALLALATAQRERAVRRAERRLDALFRHAHDIVAVVEDGRLTFVSSAFGGLLGHDPHAATLPARRRLVHPDDAERLAGYLAAPDGTLQDVRLRHADGGHRWFDVHATDLRANRWLRGLVVTAHEVGERKALQEELSRRAAHDALTGLLTRTEFAARLTAVAAAAPSGYTVLYLDLDRFKPVNDTHGHDAGDAVLRAVADRIRASAPAGSAVCRLGGDEFAVLLTGDAAAAAERIAALLVDRVSRPVPLPGTGVQVRVGATVGIAAARGEAPGDVLRNADLAMYRGKRDGRGRVAAHP